MTDPITPLFFDTALAGCGDPFAAWQTALTNFDLSRCETTPFRAKATIWLLSPIMLVNAAVDPLRYDRDADRMKRDSNDHFALVQLISGSFDGDFGKGVARSEPGSLTVLDMRRACWTDAARLDAFILSIPRAFLAPSLGDLDPHGMIVSGGLATLFGAVLSSLPAALGAMERDQAPVVARLLRDLVAEALLDAQRVEAVPGASQTRADALVTRVRSFIDANLRTSLEVGSICTAVGTSRSTLYRAFGGSGGVLQQVLRRRLNAMRMRLDDPADTRSIADIATSVGFADKSHAARVFKREFGLTPGEYRRSGPQGILAPARMEDVPQVFERFASLLD